MKTCLERGRGLNTFRNYARVWKKGSQTLIPVIAYNIQLLSCTCFSNIAIDILRLGCFLRGRPK